MTSVPWAWPAGRAWAGGWSLDLDAGARGPSMNESLNVLGVYSVRVRVYKAVNRGPPGCLLAAQTVALSGCHHHPGDPVHPSNSVLLSATHPPFCSVSHCLSGVPEVETRGAPLPLTAAAASLLPASRRVPGPVAGLHHTPPLLLPPATCGLPTPFSTSFPPRRSRSVMGEVALVFLGVVGGAWA